MKTLIAALVALSALTTVATARPIAFPPQFDGPQFGPKDLPSIDGPQFGPSDVRSFDGPAQTWSEGGNQR